MRVSVRPKGKRRKRRGYRRPEVHRLGPWVRGVNYALPAEELQPDEIFDMRSMRVGYGGDVIQRDGWKPNGDNSSSIGAFTLVACGKQRFSAASSKIFAIAGTNFYEDVSGTWTSRTNGLTITAGDDNTYSLVNANGTLIGHNGVSGDSLIKWAASGNIATLDVDAQFTTAKWWEWWDGRAWAGNTNNAADEVQRSSNTDIETWGGDLYALGEDVTGVKALGRKALAIHGETNITILSPTQNASIPYSKYGRSGRGAVSGRSILQIPAPDPNAEANRQLFVRRDGIYEFSGSEARKISWVLDGPRFWDLLNEDRLSQSFACLNEKRNEAWFFLPLGTSQTKFNAIMIYNYIRGIWYGPMISAHTGLQFNCADSIDRVAHAGGHNDTGRLYTLDKTDIINDLEDGSTKTAISAYMTTGAPAPAGSDLLNRWLFARHLFDVKGDYDVSITHFAQGIPSTTTTFAQSGGYDAIETSFEIETSQIAGESLMAFVDTSLNGYDATIQFKYANSSTDETFAMRRTLALFRPLGRYRRAESGVH